MVKTLVVKILLKKVVHHMKMVDLVVMGTFFGSKHQWVSKNCIKFWGERTVLGGAR